MLVEPSNQECIAEVDAEPAERADGDVEKRSARIGRRSRKRFSEPALEPGEPSEPIAAPRVRTGSIALSFAVVSFRTWPKRGL